MKSLDLRVHVKYRLQHRIGGGSFGEVYLAIDVNTDEEVAIKLEHESIDPSLLREEVEVYKSLAGGAGIPTIYWFGRECEYRAMVFELLGPSLEDLFNYCGRHFSLKTVLMIADQLICRLQYIHSKNMIHRDIKPENFLMGMGRNGNCIYVTDLGLAAGYRPNRAGTAVFASVTGHLGRLINRLVGGSKQESWRFASWKIPNSLLEKLWPTERLSTNIFSLNQFSRYVQTP